MEQASCGVGFLVSLQNEINNDNLKIGLRGLKNVEHRGGVGKDKLLGDGAGIMTDIPFELLGYEKYKIAVATIFAPQDKKKFETSKAVFEQTFAQFGLKILDYRDVPVNPDVLSPMAVENMPRIIQAIIERPEYTRTLASFDKKLYLAKQMVRTKQKEAGIVSEFFFSSLSCQTIVYKALATSSQLEEFYLDLQNPQYKTKLVMFHRRFSTNTLSSWDKVQPFRIIAHNGEINTVEGNKSAAVTREMAVGLQVDELITRKGTSDSGNLNEMVEALKYRSSIPHLAEILSIMVPPANNETSEYFQFWSRAMEPWDGPALIGFCDGKRIGARLDRNGFRPCRWMKTEKNFYLASEAGCFEVDPKFTLEQGALYAGRSVSIHILKAEVSFLNPDHTKFYRDAHFDARLQRLDYTRPENEESYLDKKNLFYYTREDLNKVLYPMIEKGKEPIGSMGDTARLPAMSSMHRSIYDYFYQNFAQVTNPPLDYIREKMVTELKVYLGRKPNIFEPKELIPPPMALVCKSPILSLGQMEKIQQLDDVETSISCKTFDILFSRDKGVEGLKSTIKKIVDQVVKSVKNGATIIILSDRNANYDNLPIPAIMVMRAVQLELNRTGIRLRISLIVDSGEIRNSHQVAVLIGFGASAVCPYLALDIARHEPIASVEHLFADEREQSLIRAMESGLLRIMAKRGISVVRSYQGAELFTLIGLGQDIVQDFFPRHKSIIGGLNYDNLVNELLERTEETKEGDTPHTFLYKEHASGKMGELHSITTKRTKILHQLLKEEYASPKASEMYDSFAQELNENAVNIRHLLKLKPEIQCLDVHQVEPAESILKTFGCGAMSFGAISAESQRDLIKAFKEVGGRSNSGEGGENPYYFEEGITASVKQIASGRFGVTAEYLVAGNEVQIKIAQGAKPGEGGQLMGVKVNEDIARARYANPGVDLISPPPQHDIYSIEDLKQLIYELKQLKPGLRVSVKLVAGHNIGAIALGVVKAGADAIQISGGDGGTGAASLMSMKHAGLPWEIGLLEVHRMLTENNYRENVVLRVDGGLQTGRDILMGAILGAEEFDFGKMALISQGCIMARICEKNTCPAGIATHDPKFKARYKGKVEEVVKFLKYLAEDVRKQMAKAGVKHLKDLVGRCDLITTNDKYQELITKFNLNLDNFIADTKHDFFKMPWDKVTANDLNAKVLEDVKAYSGVLYKGEYPIQTTHKAIPATVAGYFAQEKINARIQSENFKEEPLLDKKVELTFKGSAGQGFGVFNNHEMALKLIGEANDSVAKGMSGGSVTIVPHENTTFDPARNVLVGNACLYGATGGTLFLNGMAGDRFAVRNSGATAVVEGVGLHACEYMTGGNIVILGNALENVGAGMTGGTLFLNDSNTSNINGNYIQRTPILEKDKQYLLELITSYHKHTGSARAQEILEDFDHFVAIMDKYVPINLLTK
jgi:glutamate synthase domain-containing protein 2/glutamate synthase domain-containing protein 1/glutamate synthase domain-containing protein 3